MLGKILNPLSEPAYAILRFFTGAMFAFHGAQKLLGVLGAPKPEIGSQMWFGGLIELLCGTAIAVGFLTPWAAFLSSGTMAVAYLQFHWKLQFTSMIFPALNQGELALVYSLLFLFIACKGAGLCSVDRRLQNARQRRS